MKFQLTPLLLTAPLALAFAPTPARHTKSVALYASRDSVASSAICGLCSLGLAAQIAVAAPLEQQNDLPAPIYSTSAIMSATTVDQFTLPSYDAAKGVAVIDLKDEVQDVNKKTMANAKARREVSPSTVSIYTFISLAINIKIINNFSYHGLLKLNSSKTTLWRRLKWISYEQLKQRKLNSLNP